MAEEIKFDDGMSKIASNWSGMTDEEKMTAF